MATDTELDLAIDATYYDNNTNEIEASDENAFLKMLNSSKANNSDVPNVPAVFTQGNTDTIPTSKIPASVKPASWAVAGATSAIPLTRGRTQAQIQGILGIVPRSSINSNIAAAIDAFRTELRGFAFNANSSDRIETAKLADGAITTIKIGANQVTEAKMANNSVGTDQLVNGSVTQQKLATGVQTWVTNLAANRVTASLEPWATINNTTKIPTGKLPVTVKVQENADISADRDITLSEIGKILRFLPTAANTTLNIPNTLGTNSAEIEIVNIGDLPFDISVRNPVDDSTATTTIQSLDYILLKKVANFWQVASEYIADPDRYVPAWARLNDTTNIPIAKLAALTNVVDSSGQTPALRPIPKFISDGTGFGNNNLILVKKSAADPVRYQKINGDFVDKEWEAWLLEKAMNNTETELSVVTTTDRNAPCRLTTFDVPSEGYLVIYALGRQNQALAGIPNFTINLSLFNNQAKFNAGSNIASVSNKFTDGDRIYYFAENSAGKLLVSVTQSSADQTVYIGIRHQQVGAAASNVSAITKSTQLTDMPDQATFDAAAVGQVLAKAADGYILVDQTAPSNGGAGGGLDWEDVDTTINVPSTVTGLLTTQQSATINRDSDTFYDITGEGASSNTVIFQIEFAGSIEYTVRKAAFEAAEIGGTVGEQVTAGIPTFTVRKVSDTRIRVRVTDVRSVLLGPVRYYRAVITPGVMNLKAVKGIDYNVPASGDELYFLQYILNGIVQCSIRFDSDQVKALTAIQEDALFSTLSASNSIRKNFYTEGDTTTRQRTLAITRKSDNELMIGDSDYLNSRDGNASVKLIKVAAASGSTAAQAFPSEVQAYNNQGNNLAMADADIGKYLAIVPTTDIRYTFNKDKGNNGQAVWLANNSGTAGNDIAVYGGVNDAHLLRTLKQNEVFPFIKINNVWVDMFDVESAGEDSRLPSAPADNRVGISSFDGAWHLNYPDYTTQLTFNIAASTSGFASTSLSFTIYDEKQYRVSFIPYATGTTTPDITKTINYYSAGWSLKTALQTRTVGTQSDATDLSISSTARLAQDSNGNILYDMDGVGGLLQIDVEDEVTRTYDIEDLPNESEYNNAQIGDRLQKGSDGYELVAPDDPADIPPAEAQFHSGLTAITDTTNTIHRYGGFVRSVQVNVTNQSTGAGSISTYSDDNNRPPYLSYNSTGHYNLMGLGDTEDDWRFAIIGGKIATVPSANHGIIEYTHRGQRPSAGHISKLICTNADNKLAVAKPGSGVGVISGADIQLVTSAANPLGFDVALNDQVAVEAIPLPNDGIRFQMWFYDSSASRWHACNDNDFTTGKSLFSVNSLHISDESTLMLSSLKYAQHNGYENHSGAFTNTVRGHEDDEVAWGTKRNIATVKTEIDQSRNMNFTGELKKSGSDVLTKSSGLARPAFIVKTAHYVMTAADDNQTIGMQTGATGTNMRYVVFPNSLPLNFTATVVKDRDDEGLVRIAAGNLIGNVGNWDSFIKANTLNGVQYSSYTGYDFVDLWWANDSVTLTKVNTNNWWEVRVNRWIGFEPPLNPTNANHVLGMTRSTINIPFSGSSSYVKFKQAWVSKT